MDPRDEDSSHDAESKRADLGDGELAADGEEHWGPWEPEEPAPGAFDEKAWRDGCAAALRQLGESIDALRELHAQRKLERQHAARLTGARQRLENFIRGDAPSPSPLDAAATSLFQAPQPLEDLIEHVTALVKCDAEGAQSILAARPFELPARKTPLTVADLKVMYSVTELMRRWIIGETTEALPAAAYKFVRECDRTEPVGLYPLPRLDLPAGSRGGGTDAQLYRTLLKEVREYRQRRLTRHDVALLLADTLRRRYRPEMHLPEAAKVVVDVLPADNIQAIHAEDAQDEPFTDDPEKALNAAFGAFGLSSGEVNQLAAALRQPENRGRRGASGSNSTG